MSDFLREVAAIYIAPNYFQRKEKVRILQPRKLRNYSKKNQNQKKKPKMEVVGRTLFR